MNRLIVLMHRFIVTLLLFGPLSHAETSVWKISKGDNYFYLGGTIHVLRAKDHPLPPEFHTAYKNASEIIFETDLVAIEKPEFQALFMQAMSYSDERTLSSELSKPTYNRLEQFLSARQIPIASLARFQPWGVSVMITLLEYQRLGMIPDYGVDQFFKIEAIADEKPISGLETPEEHLNFITSMATVDPNEMIEYTLRDLQRLPDFVELMTNSWRSGDIEAFTSSEVVVEMKTEYPDVYNALITTRNNNWMKQLALLFDDSDHEFVLVGSLHLNDKAGLLNQLKKLGFQVEQL